MKITARNKDSHQYQKLEQVTHNMPGSTDISKINHFVRAIFILALSLIGIVACGGGSSAPQDSTSQNPTYNVIYDGNGNDRGSVPVDATNYQAGQIATVEGNPGS
ncbi:MAG: hypothetical protein KZQ73_02560, partial [Candidatus Thiodiazotropha sp. (ex Semelilucina semeliformis)]|nr:hypothetical protein [Candidatus Thiodiazotropha sp. (ex Semelilucina semeliformis)]